MTDEPLIFPEDDCSRARRAMIKFQSTLDWFEQELKPLRPEMSLECQFELDTLGRVARSFYRMANAEVFGKVRKEVLR
jgi:hypothetical protein